MSEKIAERLLLGPDGEAMARAGGFETEYGLQVKRGRFAFETTLPEGMTEEEIENSNHEAMGRDTPTQRFLNAAYGEDYNTYDQYGRLYVDIGGHPERATNEDTNFLFAAYRALHGHVHMRATFKEAARRIALQEGYDPQVLLTANVCDAHGNTWGSHDSLQVSGKVNLREFTPARAAHNTSMIVWAGAGLVRRGESEYGEFTYELSERAPHFQQVAGTGTTCFRPLVNLRDEPLADLAKYRRVHNISNDSVMSPTVLALRLASQSIIFRAVELGESFDDLVPVNPVKAFQAISSDITLKEKVLLQNGKEYTGVELQRALAELALEAAFKADYITDQELEWGETWIDVLDMLDRGPISDATVARIEWVRKLVSIQHQLKKKRHAGDKSSDFDIAFLAAVDLHRLLPNEGVGMRSLRKGVYALSPSNEILDNGLPQPDTRAKLRNALIAYLQERRIPFKADWDHIMCSPKGSWNGAVRLSLPEPLQTENDDLWRRIGAAA